MNWGHKSFWMALIPFIIILIFSFLRYVRGWEFTGNKYSFIILIVIAISLGLFLVAFIDGSYALKHHEKKLHPLFGVLMSIIGFIAMIYFAFF